MLIDYLKLALRSLHARKLRSSLTMVGIFIGIAAVVALISLSQGLKSAVNEQFVQLGTDKIIIQAAGGGFGPPGTGITKLLTEQDKKAVAKAQEVNIVTGRLIRIVSIEYDNELKYNYAASIPPDPGEKDLVIEANDYKLAAGDFFDARSSGQVILGADFAQDFFEKPVQLRDHLIIQKQDFKVVGILQKSGNPQKDSTLILPEESLRSLLFIPNQYDLLVAQLGSGQNINKAATSIAKELRKSRNVEQGKENFMIQTPQQLLSTLNTILLIIQGVLIGIAAISLVVGGIGIMNTMYTAVIERTTEIGIMKALGAKEHEILLLFLIESGFLGFVGGVIGVILGFALAKTVEIGAQAAFGSPLIAAQISWPLILGALLFAIIIGTISGTFPAKQAAKLKVVDALRK